MSLNNANGNPSVGFRMGGVWDGQNVHPLEFHFDARMLTFDAQMSGTVSVNGVTLLGAAPRRFFVFFGPVLSVWLYRKAWLLPWGRVKFDTEIE